METGVIIATPGGAATANRPTSDVLRNGAASVLFNTKGVLSSQDPAGGC
jgi:hypothetical protein